MKLIINSSNLLEWFDSQKKDYPWGRDKTPYLVWISEIMLQQTVAASVIPYFEKWSVDFPDIISLADADLNDVLSHWEGLGYYSRCRNLHKAANALIENHGSKLPDTYKELLALPGIGDYTARAILSIAFKKPFAVLDANVRRIAQRLTAQHEWTKADDKKMTEKLEKLIPPDRPGDFNEAMMQLGQQICTSSSPQCVICPVSENCLAYKQGIAEEIPKKLSKTINKLTRKGIILILEGKILMRRKKRGLFHDLWLFPLEENNDGQFIREMDIGKIDINPVILKKRNHFYTDNKVNIEPNVFFIDDNITTINTPESDDDYHYQWIGLAELEDYPSPSVYRKILNEVKEIRS